MPTAFASPLRIKLQTEFTAIGFGRVAATPAVRRLRQELNDILFQLPVTLPAPLASEARAILSGYSGGDGDFYRLFYVPIWSWLHWAPAAARTPLSEELLATARTAHALALFLHLWDDHLCDRQLAVDPLRLQVRTLAWEQFVAASQQLCARAGAHPHLVAAHTDEYLTSLQYPAPITDLDSYCARFARQIAIWTLTPRLLGGAGAGPAGSAALCDIVTGFAIAWRLLDDLQDTDEDLLRGAETAVWIELDEVGRTHWRACQAQSLAQGELALAEWRALAAALHTSGCLSRLLARIDAHLRDAACTATVQGWDGIARELEQCRQGLPT